MPNYSKKPALNFDGNRPIVEIKKAVKKAGGQWDESRYAKGSDWMTFYYKGRSFTYAPCSGRFMVSTGKTIVSESTRKMERYKWYIEVLNLLYLPRNHQEG